MDAPQRLALTEHFATLPDPRIDRTKRHLQLSIVTIALYAVLCRADSWDAIGAFGMVRAAWFASFLDLPGGSPRTLPSSWCWLRSKWTPSPMRLRRAPNCCSNSRCATAL